MFMARWMALLDTTNRLLNDLGEMPAGVFTAAEREQASDALDTVWDLLCNDRPKFPDAAHVGRVPQAVRDFLRADCAKGGA
jgi:hypothetical protein